MERSARGLLGLDATVTPAQLATLVAEEAAVVEAEGCSGWGDGDGMSWQVLWDITQDHTGFFGHSSEKIRIW